MPGCSNGTFLDLHHLQPRSEGGAHTASNLLTVCTAHHRALHRGTLKIERGADGTLSVQRGVDGTLNALNADGCCHGVECEPPAFAQPVSPQPGPIRSSSGMAVVAKVRSGLCGLGFRRTEVERVLRQLATHEELREAAPDQWLCTALLRLTRPGAQPRSAS